ncbi:MAG: hypothetical protein N3F63_00500 [Thermoplasmata archaeon]|nr:hypothetical protein [Thermoplasmata archaeon]
MVILPLSIVSIFIAKQHEEKEIEKAAEAKEMMEKIEARMNAVREKGIKNIEKIEKVYSTIAKFYKQEAYEKVLSEGLRLLSVMEKLTAKEEKKEEEEKKDKAESEKIAREKLEECRKKLEEIKERGVKIHPRIEEMLAEIESNIGAEKYADAERLAGKLQKIESVLVEEYEKAVNFVKEISKLLEERETLKAAFDEDMARVQSLLGEGNYKEAVKECTEIIDRVKAAQYYMTAVENEEKKIEATAELYYERREEVPYLDARKNIAILGESGRYEEALALASAYSYMLQSYLTEGSQALVEFDNIFRNSDNYVQSAVTYYQSQVSYLRKKVEEGKNLEINTADAENLLADADKFFSERKYGDALDNVLLAKSYLYSATENKLNSLISNVESFLASETAISPEDMGKFRARVEEAKELVGRKRYFEANKILAEIKDEFLKVRDAVLTTMKATLEKKIEEAEKQGIDVPGVKRLMSIAEREIAKENYAAAVSHYKNAIDGIDAVVIVEVEKKLADAEKFASYLSDLPEGKFVAKLGEIRGKKDGGNAFELLRETLELEKIFAEDLNRLVESKLSVLTHLENLKSMLNVEYQIPKITCTGYSDAENCIKEVESFIKDTNEKFRTAFEKVVEEGNRKMELAIPDMDISVEKNQFKEMLKAINEARWDVAIEHYNLFIKTLEKNVIDFVKKRVREHLRPLNAAAQQLGVKGLSPKDIGNLIKNINLENAKATYSEILELEASIEKDTIALLNDKFTKINASVEIAESIGFGVGEIKGEMEKAKMAIQEKRFAEANNALEEIKKVIASSLAEFVNAELTGLKSLINSAVEKKIDIGDVHTYLNDAESLIRRNNIIKAHEKIREGHEQIVKVFAGASTSMEQTLRKCIAAMERLGIEWKDIDAESQTVGSLKAEGKFFEIVELLYRLIDEATDRLASQWLNLYKYAEQLVFSMERYGLGFGYRERLENARMLASTNRTYEALIEIINLLAESDELMRAEALKILEKLTYLAETGGKYGIVVTYDSATLERIRQLIEANRYFNAIEEAYPVYRSYTKLFEKYLSDMLTAFHEGLKTLRTFNIDTTPYAERIDTYQSYISANDWKNGLEYGTELRNEIQNTIKKKVEEVIEETGEKLRMLETRGEDISKIKFMQEVAIEKLKQGDIQKAVSAAFSAREGAEKAFGEKCMALIEYWDKIITALEKYSPQPDMLEKLGMLRERAKVNPQSALETDSDMRRMLKEKMVMKNRENEKKLGEVKKEFANLKMDWGKMENHLRMLSAKENFEVVDIQNIMTFVEGLNQEIKIKLAKTIVEFENQLSLIEDSGKREEIRATIAKSKDMLNAGQIEGANTEIGKIAAGVRKVIEDTIEARMSETVKIIAALNVLNLNFHIYENRYLDAKEHLAREEYSKALEILENIMEQGNKEIEDHIAGIEREITDAMEIMKRLDIDTAEISEKHALLKQHAASKDFDAVSKIYPELKGKIIKMMEENLLSAINQCDLLIEFAVGIGIDVSHPKELLNKGKIRFASKMYVQAKNLITKALSSTEEAVRRYIANEIGMIAPQIEMLALLGIPAEEHRNLLEEAKRKLDVRDYMGAQSISVKLKKQVEDLLEENSTKLLAEIRSCIEKGAQIGAETTLFERMYLTAQAFINGRNYEGLVSLAKDAKNKFIEVTNEVFRAHIETFGRWLDILAIHGISDENYVEIRNMARNTFEAGNTTEAAKIIKNALNDMEITVRDRVLKRKEEIEERVSFLRKYGVQLSPVEVAIKNIATDVEKRDYIEARNHIEQANKALNQIAEIKVRELLSSLKGYIGKLKKSNVPVTDRSNEIEVLLTAGKHFDAITRYEEILAEVDSNYARHILEIAEETEGYIKTSGNLLASTENFIETLKQVKYLVETRAYDDAYQIATQVRYHVTAQIEGRINGAINEAQGYIERFKTLGPEILSAAIVLNNASLSLSQKKYSEAYELATSAINKIMSSVREYTTREIEDYKSFIADCERIGIDVTKFREGVVRAERSLRDNRVVETYYTIKETKKLGDESMSTYLASRINDTMARIDEAERLGVDTVKIIHLKNRVAAVQQSPNVLDALRELKNIEQDTTIAAEEKVKEVFESIDGLYSYFSRVGLNLSEAEGLLKIASQNIASKNLVDAMAVLIECESVVIETVEKYITSELAKWQKFLVFLMKVVPEFSSLVEQIKKVQDLLVVKDYKKAHHMLNELSSAILKNVNEKLLPAIEAKLQEVVEVRKIGIDASRVEAMIREAIEKLRAGEYLRVKEIFENASAQFDNMLAAHSNNEIEIFARNLDVAKMLGIDTSQYSALLPQFKSQVSGGKYRETLLQISTIQKELYEKLKSVIEKNVAKCIEEMEVASELNIDFSEVNALLESAAMKIKYMDMMAAYQMVTKAKEIIPEIVRSQIAREIELQLERGSRLRERGIDISKHEHLLHKAKERLGAGKYSEAKFLIVRYMNSILPVLEENFDKSIDYLRATINTAKVIGIKVEGEDALWGEIKKRIGTGDYIGANELIEVYQSNLIEKIETTVKAELQKFTTLLEIAIAYKCPVSSIAESHSHTQTEFQSKKYVNALKQAKQNIEQLEEILRERAGIELKNLEAEIKEYASHNVDTSVAEKVLDEAKKRLGEKNYSLAFESITHARHNLEQNAIGFEKKVIEEVQRLVDNAVEMKINIEQGSVLFNNGKELYNTGKLLEALSPLVSSREKITQAIKNELRSRIETMNSTLELGREMKIDVSEIERNIQSAQKSLLINSFEETHRFITAATSKFVSVATAALGTEISKVEAIINVGETIGCNLALSRKEILKAKEMVVNKEFAGAKKHIDEIAAKTKKTVSARVLEEINGSKAVLGLAKQFRIEVSKQEEVLKNAEELVRKERYQEAYNHAIEIKAYLVNSVVKFLNTEISSVNGLLNVSGSIGVPELSPAREDIDESLKKLHEMDFEGAYAKLDAARNRIIKNATEYLNALVKDAENILADAKNVEAVVSEELYAEIETAKAHINQQRFREARDVALGVYEKGLNIAKDKIQERLNVLNSLLDLTKNFGIPVETAPETMKTISEMLAAKNFKGANKKCLELTKKVSDLLQSYCETQILNTAKLVDLGESIGIKMLEIKRSVEGTWGLLRNRQYLDVVNLTNDVQTKIHGMLDHFLMDEVQRIQNDIKYAESIGANAAKVREMLEGAQTKHREKDYTAAHRALVDTEVALGKVLTRHISDSVSVARLTYDIGLRIGVDLNDINEKFRQIENLSNEKKFREAYFTVVETRKNIISRIENYMSDALNDVNQKIETASELGVDVTNARAMFEIAKNTIRGKDYLEAKKILGKIEENVDTLCRNNLLEEYERIMKTVEEFKAKNVDVSEVVSGLERVKSRIDKKLYVEAKLALETVRAKIRTIERIVKLGV